MQFYIATLGEPALRLDLALVLGSATGIERQWQQKRAGLRTGPCRDLVEDIRFHLALGVTVYVSKPLAPSRTVS